MAAAFVLAAVLFYGKVAKSMEQEYTLRTPYGPIKYTLARKRVKNINLRIRQDGSVHISAGLRVPLKAIESVLLERSQWIIRGIAEQKEKQAQRKGSLFLWGERLEVIVYLCPADEKECCIVSDGKAIFRVNDLSDAARRQALWQNYLLMEAKKTFVPLFEQWSERFILKYGVKKQRLSIKPMTSRWGSRSMKTERIALNLYLAAKPKEYLEYTIVHELCHLLRMDHSPEFHRLVEENLPGAHLIEHRMRHESSISH